MDLEVVGRHALLFDDDATAAFVNSSDALVDWNSLLIDRYDVRHLLSGPPPPRRRRQTHSPPSISSIESELDQERYLDLPPPSEEQESDELAKPDDPGGYHNVAFSYGNTDDSADQKNSNDGLRGSGFRPPFPVPESLLQSLMLGAGWSSCDLRLPFMGTLFPFDVMIKGCAEKVHQIIARTAMFVSKHGGQSEIVLRVKQGDNPTFGFLMPDHHLHAYFRFLVDHQDILLSDTDGKSETEKKGDAESNQTDGVVAGALSLLGSVYGSGEDEDGADEDGAVDEAPESKQNVSGKALDASDATVSRGFGKTEISGNVDEKKEAVGKHSSSFKEKVQIPKRSSFTSAPKSGTTNGTKKSDISGLLSTAVDNSKPSALSNMSQVEQLILEPPSGLKRLVDKIVEFILRNGKQFEAVLIEQDSQHGRFPFLLPSNQYHPYYVKVLQKAQESKLTAKGLLSEKDDSLVNGLDKKTHLSKGSDSLSSGSAGNDIPYDADRKEKFRMVIGKSKKDGQDPPSKATQPQFGVNVDAAAAAAILQAASRGIKNPNFGFFSNTSLNGDSHGRNSEGEQASSFASRLSSHPGIVTQKSGDKNVPVPVAKDIAKTAALEAANEADSSEAHLTKEQRLKSERLKRAKMFVAMLKSGAAPGKPEPFRGLSVEPQETGVSSSGNVVNFAGKEREAISVPVDVNTAEKKEDYEKKYADEFHERRSKRKYRSSSSRYEEEVEDEQEHSEDEVVVEEKRKGKDHKNSRKKHRSHRSSHEGGKEDNEERDDRYATKKHRSYHSSHHEDDEGERDRRHSRKKHRSYRSSDEDDKEEDYEDKRDYKHSRRKNRSSRSSDEDDKEVDYEDQRDHKNSRRKHRSSRSPDEDDKEEDYEDKRDHKNSRRKLRSSHSSDEDDKEEYEGDRDHKNSRRKHRSSHLSEEDNNEEYEEERAHKHSRKKHKSHSSSRHNRDKHKNKERHRSSTKNKESRNRRKHESSSDDEQLHRDSSSKHREISHSEEELEEGEISSKISERSRGSVGAGISREASLDVSSLYREGRAPSQPAEAPEVSDDLRAKIRAMLLATL